MGVDWDGWEWMGVYDRRWEWMELGGSRWGLGGSGWEYGLVQPISSF